MSVRSEPFGRNLFGEDVTLFSLTNENGIRARIMNHGGILHSLETPDKDGTFADIVLGHDTAEEYGEATPYFGCVVGRFANRIKGGTFSLNGERYTLARNSGFNALHGGIRGFDKVIWESEVLEEENAVRMTYVSADEEEGFPGEVHTTMTYTVTDDNGLKIHYTSESSKATPFNIANHSYFNLSGHDAGYRGDHRMMINADTFLPVDDTLIPLGNEAPLDGTPLDFRTPSAIGERIDADHEQLRMAGGYDQNFCLTKAAQGERSLAARVEDPTSGRVMEVFTTEPGIQFYTANSLDGRLKGKDGCLYVRRGGYCLETQHYPDSPNHPEYPTTILRPGERFESETLYRFSIR